MFVGLGPDAQVCLSPFRSDVLCEGWEERRSLHRVSAGRGGVLGLMRWIRCMVCYDRRRCGRRRRLRVHMFCGRMKGSQPSVVNKANLSK